MNCFFGLQRDLPFTFGWLIGPHGGIFCAAMSTEYVLGIHTNIMVCCAFLLRLQLFAITNLAHSTFFAAALLPRSSCARWSGLGMSNVLIISDNEFLTDYNQFFFTLILILVVRKCDNFCKKG